MSALSTAPTALPAGLTFEQFVDWLDEDVHAEWIDGEIIVMSPASRTHQQISGFLTAILKLHVEEKGLGEILAAPFQMRLAEERTGREPDVIFVSKERLGNMRDSFLDGPADVAVEIVSRESQVRDRVEKYREYMRGGVREYWLIDPLESEARFHALCDGEYREIEVVDGRFESRVIPGFWLDVEWLWSLPMPSLQTVARHWRSTGL